MQKIFKLKLKDKSAQALPEFALCLPLIMLMLGILITVGQMVYAKEVLQAAAQSFCRAYVTDYTRVTEATTKGKEHASAIMETAAMNIMLSNPNHPLASPYEIRRGRVSGNTDGADDPAGSRVIRNAKGETYEYVSVKVYGAIETLFPVQWNNNTLTPNLTFLSAYCAMIIEK